LIEVNAIFSISWVYLHLSHLKKVRYESNKIQPRSRGRLDHSNACISAEPSCGSEQMSTTWHHRRSYYRGNDPDNRIRLQLMRDR
jgi:hypothetical protein